MKFQAWRGQNDISTPEGQAAFFEWHQNTMADLIAKASPVTETKAPKFWTQTDKYDKDAIYSLFRYAQDANRRGESIVDTDLGQLVVEYIEEAHRLKPNEPKLEVHEVMVEIRNYLGVK